MFEKVVRAVLNSCDGNSQLARLLTAEAQWHEYMDARKTAQ